MLLAMRRRRCRRSRSSRTSRVHDSSHLISLTLRVYKFNYFFYLHLTNKRQGFPSGVNTSRSKCRVVWCSISKDFKDFFCVRVSLVVSFSLSPSVSQSPQKEKKAASSRRKRETLRKTAQGLLLVLFHAFVECSLVQS
jgi:hypothetical protein